MEEILRAVLLVRKQTEVIEIKRMFSKSGTFILC
jgi:hypothetical protein